MEEKFKRLENYIVDFFEWEKLGFKYNEPSLVGSLVMYKDLNEDTRVAIDFKYANADSNRPGLFIGVNAYVISNKINKIIFEASERELCQDTSSIRNLESHLITQGIFDPDYYKLNYMKGGRKLECLLRGEAVNEKAIHKLNEVMDDVLNKNIYPMFEKSQTLEDIYEHTICKVPEKRLVYHLGLGGHAKVRKMIVMGLIKHKNYEAYRNETISFFENNIDNQRDEKAKNIVRLFAKIANNTAKILEERYLS